MRHPNPRQPSEPLAGLKPQQPPPLKLLQHRLHGHPSQATGLYAGPQAGSQRLPAGTIPSNPADQERGSGPGPKTAGALRTERGGPGEAPGDSLGGSDLLEVTEQAATALEDLAIGDRGDALQAGHQAPGAGHYSPTFEPPPTRVGPLH